jgi:3-oxoacyl-[acyl-carrier protein] reductase
VSGRLVGTTALITGASRGIGLAIAQRLVADGARVVVTAREVSTLADAVAQLDQLGGAGSAVAVPGRADDPDHQDEAISCALEGFGSLDFLVNNTGINPAYGPMVELDLAAARKMFEVNCLAALSWIQKSCRASMSRQGGAIVNVSSVAGVRPAPGIGFYGATKSMLNSMTQLLAVELGPHVRVNAVAPAVVKTQFAAALYEGREEETASAYPLKRLGIPSDIGGVVAFLLSSDASWLTGQTVVVDGGVTLVGHTE